MIVPICAKDCGFMFFNKEEKVFSLSRTAASAPSRDIKTLFEEFYAFLLLAGLFREGESVEGIHVNMVAITDKGFGIPAGSYNQPLANLICKGLKERFVALWIHSGLNSGEQRILSILNRVFVRDKGVLLGLGGDQLFGVAIARGFSLPMQSIARYVSVMFGQGQYPIPVEVPGLYISALGDIHLSLSNTVTLEQPALPYGSRYEGSTEVTALWALLSAQITSLSKDYSPGDRLAELLTSFVFLANPCEFDKAIPAPLYAAALRMETVMGIDRYDRVPVAAAFYQSFLYGSCEERRVSRYDLLIAVLDLMVKMAGDSDIELFAPNSAYKRLRQRSFFRNRVPERPSILQFALEALDASEDTASKPVNEVSDPTVPVDDPSTDPQTDDGGFDPTNPAPTPMGAGVSGSVNTIGLISFDKSGEGVDEHLYRLAVVALNDRLRDDDTITVTAEVREALDYWVNGFLYLTSISSTKDYVVALKLQKYLKV